MVFGWLHGIVLTPCLWEEYNFFIYAHFSEMQLGHKTSAGYTVGKEFIRKAETDLTT